MATLKLEGLIVSIILEFEGIKVISSISSNRQSPCFGRAFSTKGLKHNNEIYAKAQQALNKSLGIEKDSKVFIMPDFSMPDIDQENTGMGRLFSDQTEKFAKFVKNYFQADAIQVLPQNKNFRVATNHFSPYSCEASVLGEQTINLKALTQKDYGEIITKTEFEGFVQKNQKKDIANAENELGLRSEPNPRLELLKTAFERFKKDNTPELNKLHQEFNDYKNNPDEAKRLERLSLYNFLKHEQNLFSENFDKSKREALIAETQKKYANEIEFFKFWQFLADNHHQQSRKILKKEGLELIGDCPTAFSNIDKWSYPEAFKGHDEWGFHKINPKRMFKEDGSLDVAGEKLQEKLIFFFKKYDGIRFDVGRRYAEHGSGEILDFIEKTAKDVKGIDFDLNKLSYEEGAGKYYKDRVKIEQRFSLEWSKEDPKIQSGIGNHDNKSIIEQSKYINPTIYKEIVESKFGHLLTFRNKFIFFTDFFGKEERFNFHDHSDPNYDPSKSFRAKLSPNYEKEYHEALQKGDGFNLMEAMGIAMKLQGLDKKEPKLYEEVVKQGQILRKKGATTQAEADKIEKKNLLKQIALGLAGVSAIVTSAALIIKNIKSQQQPLPQTKPKEEYSINPQYQHLRMIQNQTNPLI